MAGGRYDGLSETLGGAFMPGVGWAAGIERLALMTNVDYNNSPDLVLMGVSEEFNFFLLPIMSKLINSGIKTETFYTGNISKKFKRADKINASFAIIIGENEVVKNTVQLKNLKSGSQDEVQLDKAIKNIKKLLNLNLE